MSKKSKQKKTEEEIEEQVVDNAEETATEEAASEQTAEDHLATIAELQGTILRVRADFDNFRKRSQRDIVDARAFSKISTVTEILPIFDTFKMAMQAANADNADLNTLLAGLNMIQNQFGQAFSSLGMEEINAQGEEFDPNLHEAVMEQHSEEVEAGKVILQHRCGYRIGEKLIRAATVVVSKGPEVVNEEAEEAVEEEAAEE